MRAEIAYGKRDSSIEKLFPRPGAEADPRCTACEGELKDKPILGMTILRDLEEDDGEGSGGEILDPKSGTLYDCSAMLAAGGKKLKVRGYVGFSLIGRTQTWERAD